MATSVATHICSRPEGPKPISTKTFLNKWLLHTFVYLELDLCPLKWHAGAERGANIKSVQKNTISEI